MNSYKEWLDNRAKEMRNSPTVAEKRVKEWFDKHHIKYKFQVPIMVSENKGYIVDFLLFNNVVLEIDGSVHFTEEGKERDKVRTKDLENSGYRVIQMNNASTKPSNIETAVICRFKKVQPQVAKRLEGEAEKRKKVENKRKYRNYKDRLPDWDYREKIWNLSGGHFR